MQMSKTISLVNIKWPVESPSIGNRCIYINLLIMKWLRPQNFISGMMGTGIDLQGYMSQGNS